MENRKLPSKKELRNQEGKIISQVKCGSLQAGSSKRRFIQGIPQNKTSQPRFPGVQVTVQPRSPVIKTLFLAEKNRFNSTKVSEKSRSLLAIGDHLSFNNHFAEARSNSAIPVVGDKRLLKEQEIFNKILNKEFNNQLEERPGKPNNDKTKLGSPEQCYVHAQRHNTNHQNLKQNFDRESNFKGKFRKFINADCSNDKNLSASIIQVDNRIHILQSLVRRQEMVLGDFDSNHSLSSSDEDSRVKMVSRGSGSARLGCSYIENYSHVPKISAFQRYAQQSNSLSPNKGATIEKEHNSEQYGRDVTAYDGLTARGRRQCNSATCKRDDAPQASERIIKIRHKLNPVRDYRLMDTVHYLAQGEFAPRNDGIKLTPSREAVLSDIIWEDVCRTHWPATRLGRRHAQDRSSARNELQRLIDSLLRERVAHVERRRRRHYRVVKHTQQSAGRIGKTGDIIVASHKNKHRDENDTTTGHTHQSSGLMMISNRWPDHRNHRSDDRLVSPERRRVVQEDCTPGPSYTAPRSRREPTCCYQAAGTSKQPKRSRNACVYAKEKYSSSSIASSERNRRNPRLVLKKESSRKKYHEKELNLEHFILLPTLVVRTPSNVRRQKKFNELYHRILNQLSTEQDTETAQPTDPSHRNSKNDSVTTLNRGKNKSSDFK